MQSMSRHFARPQDGDGEEAVGLGAKSARKNVLQNSNGSSSSAGKPNPSVFAPRCGGHASGNFDTTIHQNHAFAMNYDDFFKAARGDESAPFDFQRRLACGERASRDEAAWLASGTDCHSQLIN